MNKTESQKLIFRWLLPLLPTDLIPLVLEYQNCIQGDLIREWGKGLFFGPRSLRIQNKFCFISDSDDEDRRLENYVGSTSRLQIFEMNKNDLKLIKQFGHHGRDQMDEFLLLIDMQVTQDGKQIILLDSDIPTFRVFSLPDFRLIGSLDDVVTEKDQDEKERQKYDLCSFANGICLNDTHFYVCKKRIISQFHLDGTYIRGFSEPCFKRLNKMIWVDNLLWVTDEFGPVHVVDAAGQCLCHYGQDVLKDAEGLAIYGTELFVLDKNCVQVFDKETRNLIRCFGEKSLEYASDIFVHEGKAWITDLHASCIFVFE
jgi:hypothetical protein